MIVCDRCRKEKKLTKYIVPIEEQVNWIAIDSQGIVLQKIYAKNKIAPKEIEICDECAVEVAKQIWN